MTLKQNVGFIGLGNIGKPMAKHLINDQYQLYAYDVFAPATEELVNLGALAASSPADMAKHCDYIGICVRDNNDVESLLYSDNGLLQTANKGSYIAIHSTVTRDGLIKWAEDAAKNGIVLFDAPITGGATGAEAATLCYMVGGDEATVAHCTPIFETSASKVIHAGVLGTGIVLKLCNNLITYTEFTAMSEAVKLAEASGLSSDVLREVGESNGVINAMMHQFISGRNAMSAAAERPEQMEEMFGPMANLGVKDLTCALQTAESLGLEMPTTNFVKNIIEDIFYNRI
tara:strand:- start:107 stop:967 length:861 start_codon:yes stop_codon:yes gene_type:complete